MRSAAVPAAPRASRACTVSAPGRRGTPPLSTAGHRVPWTLYAAVFSGSWNASCCSCLSRLLPRSLSSVPASSGWSGSAGVCGGRRRGLVSVSRPPPPSVPGVFLRLLLPCPCRALRSRCARCPAPSSARFLSPSARAPRPSPAFPGPHPPGPGRLWGGSHRPLHVASFVCPPPPPPPDPSATVLLLGPKDPRAGVRGRDVQSPRGLRGVAW
jgi:hypothetical protein